MGLDIKGKINGLVAKTAVKLGVSMLLGKIRDAAHGDLGPVWKARYDAASKLAPSTGLVLSLVTVGLVAAGQNDLAVYVGSAAGVLISAGIVNAAYLTEIPLGLRYNAVYEKLVSWAPTTTVLLTAFWGALEASGDPRIAKWRIYAAIADAIALKLGLVTAALNARGPKPVAQASAAVVD